MNSFKDFLLFIAMVVIAIGAYDTYESMKKVDSLRTDFKQLKSNIVQAQTSVKNHITLDDISRIVKKELKGAVQSKGDIHAKQSHTTQTRESTKSKTASKYHAVEKELFWKNKDGQMIPVGVAIWRPEKKQWLARMYEIDFNTKIVESRTWDGKSYHYVEAWASVPHRKGYEDVRFRLPISNAQFEVRNPDKLKLSLWNPTLSLGILGTTNKRFIPVGKFNFINWSRTSDLPVISLGSPMVGWDNKEGKLKVGIEVLSYNIGDVLPVIKDLHVGGGVLFPKDPFIGITTTF